MPMSEPSPPRIEAGCAFRAGVTIHQVAPKTLELRGIPGHCAGMPQWQIDRPHSSRSPSERSGTPQQVRRGRGTRPESELFRLQQTAGNRAVASLLTVSRVPQLRTAQDSRLRLVTGSGLENYQVVLDVGGTLQDIGTVQILVCTMPNQLPLQIEDFVDTATNRAWVVFTYVPHMARVRVPAPQLIVNGLTVHVETRAVASSELRFAAAQVPRHDRSSAGETVRGHLGSGEVDTILASVVSAEGGFGTTQTYDRAVLTWGQGQWTAHSGTLQRALRFIIDQRPDLWSRYFGPHQLDVETGNDPRFVHEGRPVPTRVPDLHRVFRPNAATSRRWVTVFAQFGLDPQVERLQRAYLRGEVKQELLRAHAGNRPDDWLTTRGKALLFSMKVNLPAEAYRIFRDAVATASGGHTGVPVPTAIQAAASTNLENQFRQSGIRAFQDVRGHAVATSAAVTIPRHHTIAFWGEQGRNRGVADCTTALTQFTGGVRTVVVGGAQVRDPWTVNQWQQHRTGLQSRQTRYEKSAADITSALTRTDIEPDVPPEILNPPTPAPASVP
jgi:hypothetical protein